MTVTRESRGGGLGRRACPSRRAFRIMLWFLWNTGARTCEARALRWSDVDYEQGVIRLRIHKTVHHDGQARLIGLHAGVLRVLRRLRRSREQFPGRRQTTFAGEQ